MIRIAALALLIFALAACGHMPWGTKPGDLPGSVRELIEMAADGTKTNAFPQYWARNTLVIDLQAAAPSGKVILKPRRGHAWPMRLAFRARPGTLGLIEVLAAQRMLIPVTREGTAPVDIELAPGIYTAKTERMVVQWGR
jgi:hypothetical protein